MALACCVAHGIATSVGCCLCKHASSPPPVAPHLRPPGNALHTHTNTHTRARAPLAPLPQVLERFVTSLRAREMAAAAAAAAALSAASPGSAVPAPLPELLGSGLSVRAVKVVEKVCACARRVWSCRVCRCARPLPRLLRVWLVCWRSAHIRCTLTCMHAHSWAAASLQHKQPTPPDAAAPQVVHNKRTQANTHTYARTHTHTLCTLHTHYARTHTAYHAHSRTQYMYTRTHTRTHAHLLRHTTPRGRWRTG